MRVLDVSAFRVVHRGEDWPHALPPCNRSMMSKLEKNEALVSWLQPAQSTRLDEQVRSRLRACSRSLSLTLALTRSH
jgi:hypothetical protein